VPRVHADLSAEEARICRGPSGSADAAPRHRRSDPPHGVHDAPAWRGRHRISDLVDRNFNAEAPNPLGLRHPRHPRHSRDGRALVPRGRPGRVHCAATRRRSWAGPWPRARSPRWHRPPSKWRPISANTRRSLITPTERASTPPPSSACAAGSQASSPRAARWATATTTQCARASPLPLHETR